MRRNRCDGSRAWMTTSGRTASPLDPYLDARGVVLDLGLCLLELLLHVAELHGQLGILALKLLERLLRLLQGLDQGLRTQEGATQSVALRKCILRMEIIIGSDPASLIDTCRVQRRTPLKQTHVPGAPFPPPGTCAPGPWRRGQSSGVSRAHDSASPRARRASLCSHQERSAHNHRRASKHVSGE